MHAWEQHLLLFTKVVRLRSDCEGCGAQTSIEAKTEDRALAFAITFLSTKAFSVVSRSQNLAFRVRLWLCKTTVTIKEAEVTESNCLVLRIV